MKKTLTLLMLLSAAALFGAFGDPGIDRMVKIDKSKQLVLAENGKSNSVIVLLKDASPTAKVAAKELQTFLKEATNADFPIVNAVDPAKVSIVIGCKKDIAKVMTVLKERELGISKPVVATVAEKKTVKKTTTKKAVENKD